MGVLDLVRDLRILRPVDYNGWLSQYIQPSRNSRRTLAAQPVEPWKFRLQLLLEQAYKLSKNERPSPVTYGHALGYLDALHLSGKIDSAERKINQARFKALLIDGKPPQY